MECIRRRVQDLDFDHRAVTLPDALTLPLQRHLGAIGNVHQKDLGDGFGAGFRNTETAPSGQQRQHQTQSGAADVIRPQIDMQG